MCVCVCVCVTLCHALVDNAPDPLSFSHSVLRIRFRVRCARVAVIASHDKDRNELLALSRKSRTDEYIDADGDTE